jgi:hypothetical protein
MVFYTCKWLSERLGHEVILPVMCILLSVVGFYLPNGRGCTDLLTEHLYYVETSLTCIGFYYVGFFLKNNTDFLSSDSSLSSVILIFVFGLLVYGVGWYYDYADTGFRLNFFEFPLLPLYMAGLAGSVGIILLAKLVGYLPYFYRTLQHHRPAYPFPYHHGARQVVSRQYIVSHNLSAGP